MFEYRRVYATQPENGMVLTDFQVKICQKLSHPLINPKKASTFTSGRQQTHLYNCQFQRIPTNSPVNRFLDIFPSSIFPTGPVAALILVIAGTHLSSGSSGCCAPLPSRPTPFNPLVNQNVPYSNGRCLYPIPTSSPPQPLGAPTPSQPSPHTEPASGAACTTSSFSCLRSSKASSSFPLLEASCSTPPGRGDLLRICGNSKLHLSWAWPWHPFQMTFLRPNLGSKMVVNQDLYEHPNSWQNYVHPA